MSAGMFWIGSAPCEKKQCLTGVCVSYVHPKSAGRQVKPHVHISGFSLHHIGSLSKGQSR